MCTYLEFQGGMNFVGCFHSRWHGFCGLHPQDEGRSASFSLQKFRRTDTKESVLKTRIGAQIKARAHGTCMRNDIENVGMKNDTEAAAEWHSKCKHAK